MYFAANNLSSGIQKDGPILGIMLLVIIMFSGGGLYAKQSQISTSWVATDSIGRALPDHDQVGRLKKDKFVAMFYWTWHIAKHAEPGYVNIDQVIRKIPDSVNDYNHPVWERYKNIECHHWGEPLFGYYRTTDPWVLRKHAEMLADAGVDVIVFDCTNKSLTWKESYDILCQTWQQAMRDGVNTPKIAFFLPFGPYDNSLISIEKIYKDIYEPGRYKDLWFYWQNKPLIIAYPDNIPEPIKSFFTFRPGQPGYRCGPQRKDDWSWLEVYPQHGYVEYAPGKYEMVSVGVAQNATDDLVPAAMNDKDQVYGRSYTKVKGFDKRPDAVLYGLNFQEQWDRALELDPKLVFVTGWNEWVAGRFESWQGTENAFPDQYNMEYSRDIEPVKAEIGDNYYYQLVSNIRKFKGAEEQQIASKYNTVKIDGSFCEWIDIEPEYLDHMGDTMHRNHPGYGDLVYTNESGRNDFVRMKTACDKSDLYFYADCAESITRPADFNWMILFIDVDRDKNTGWQGYDYLINRKRTADNNTSIEKNIGNKWNWVVDGDAEFAVNGTEVEIQISRKAILDKVSTVDIEFKWADNIKGDGDVMDFYISGDVAPSGRFNYVYTFRDELKLN